MNVIEIDWGRNRPGLKRCDKCSELIKKADRIVVKTIQWTQMRGDDTVLVYHVLCSPVFNKAVEQSQNEFKARQHNQS